MTVARAISGPEVRRLLPIEDCVELMESVLVSLQRGELHQPLRSVIAPPEARGLLGLMPSHRAGERPLFALKAVAVIPDNPSRGLDAHQGLVVLFDGEDGTVRGLVDASAITELRTAAVTAVATRALAQPGASTVAIIGSGVQARSHLRALAAVLEFERVSAWSPNTERLEAYGEWAADELGLELELAATAAAAVAGAAVVVTATASTGPVVAHGDLAEGAHVNAVGSSVPWTRELDTATMAAAAVYVDRRESTLNESGDFLIAAEEASLGPEHIRAELGEVLAGAAPGRTDDAELTVFVSLGLAVQDLAAAELVLERAVEAGAGTEVEL